MVRVVMLSAGLIKDADGAGQRGASSNDCGIAVDELTDKRLALVGIASDFAGPIFFMLGQQCAERIGDLAENFDRVVVCGVCCHL